MDPSALANLTARTDGVETDLTRTRAARQARHALIHLLRARGVDVVPGEEMRGQNRRRARKGLAAIAAPAFALRGLSAPSEVEITEAARVAQVDFERLRRLALPRTLIARLLEVALVMDRAAALRDRGAEVIVATICDATATPRNLGIFASRDAARLPRAYALIRRASRRRGGGSDAEVDLGRASRRGRCGRWFGRSEHDLEAFADWMRFAEGRWSARAGRRRRGAAPHAGRGCGRRRAR